jgi:hypothetical protein
MDGFREYLSAGVAMAHPIDGEPRLILSIDPVVHSISLRGPRRAGEDLPVTGLEHVRTVSGPGGGDIELRVTDSALFLDAYPVLCAVADRVQLNGSTMSDAIRETLRLLGRFLRRTPTLTRERELGLCGELLVFIGLCKLVGPSTAVAGWRGPHGEEHDFAMLGHDVEVKSTTSEHRMHWIDSLTQLEPTADTPLWLVSHQFTEAGPNQGWRLRDLVDAARSVAGLAVRDDFERRLDAAGWTESHDEIDVMRWRRRFPSAAFLVAGEFPRLTSKSFTSDTTMSRGLVEVRYKIDLSDQYTDQPVPSGISAAIATEVPS